MSLGFSKIYPPKNEKVLEYRPMSNERLALEEVKRRRAVVMDIPMVIDGKAVRTGNKLPLSCPHDHKHILGYYEKGGQQEVNLAIEAALKAKEAWENTHWETRAAVFMKAADLISGPYRASINAATMLGQSKNAYQAEIDAACELADFLRFNVFFMTQIYADQPINSEGVWNRVEFTAIGGICVCINAV